MNLKESKNIVIKTIVSILDEDIIVDDDTKLIGNNAILDSFKLVELCLSLEDQSNRLGFEFDWRSEKILSKTSSPFRSSLSLAEEFLDQYKKSLS